MKIVTNLDDITSQPEPVLEKPQTDKNLPQGGGIEFTMMTMVKLRLYGTRLYPQSSKTWFTGMGRWKSKPKRSKKGIEKVQATLMPDEEL